MSKKLKNPKQLKPKTISFDILKKLSDTNYGRLNRNIDVDWLKEEYSNIENYSIELQPVLIHYHFVGEPTKPHLRCLLKLNQIGVIGIQDVFFNQWDELKNIKI
jgi:hypothetical protein